MYKLAIRPSNTGNIDEAHFEKKAKWVVVISRASYEICARAARQYEDTGHDTQIVLFFLPII